MRGLKGAASASMLAARALRHAGELPAELGWPLGPGCEPAQSDCSIPFVDVRPQLGLLLLLLAWLLSSALRAQPRRLRARFTRQA